MIKRIICVLIMLILTVSVSAFAENDAEKQEGTVYENGLVPLTDENILFSGRWSDTEKGSKKCGFEGYVEVAFTGTSIKVTEPLSGRAYAVVDGKEPKNAVNLSGKESILAKNLEEGSHTLRLYAKEQTAFPEIGGFEIDEGAKILPVKRGKIIEFVGDSIMEGYVDGKDAGQWGANSYMNSYARLTGEMLNEKYGMSFNTIAYGGSGLLTVSADPLPMSVRYFKAIEKRASDTATTAVPDWNMSEYVPDYIVINTGTNDRGGNPMMFKATYLSFVKKLRQTYPQAEIVLMIPFKFYDDNQKGLIDAIKQIVSETADEKIHLADTEEWNIKGGADNLHPSPESHKLAAQKLFDYLSEIIDGKNIAPTETTEIKETAKNGGPVAVTNPHGINIPVIITSCAIGLAVIVAVIVTIIKRKS